MAQFRTQEQVKLRWWPSPQDYNEAVQNLGANLVEDELKNGLVYQDALGLPRPVTGAFASVYRVQCRQRDLAFRCFLRNVSDQAQRYHLISQFVQNDDLPYTVTFDFLEQGIRIAGQWVPALKMDWVEGESLDQYIVENLANPYKLMLLQELFITMMDELARAGIAHGDLQHGNVMVCGKELRLVDYDGMYVPAMAGFQSNELGHRNYQHPARNASHFGPYLDNFSAWVIYASIRALQIDPRLLHQLGGGDDCLLFRQCDFIAPLRSQAFAAFEKHTDLDIQMLGRFLRSLLKLDPAQVPRLKLPVAEVKNLEPLPENVPTMRQGARLVRGSLPDWLQDSDVVQAAPVETGKTTPQNAAYNRKLSEQEWLNKSWTVQQGNTVQQWISPGQSTASQSSSYSSNYNNSVSQYAGRGVSARQNVPHVQQTIPPEALQPTPRPVRYDNSKGFCPRPLILTILSLFSPFVWLAVMLSFAVMTVDQDLRVHGMETPATISNVSTTYSSKRGYTSHIDYKWDDGLRAYSDTLSIPGQTDLKEGAKVSVITLPTNPSVHEPLFGDRGKKQENDSLVATIFWAINVIVQLAIWIPALRHRTMAEYGTPALATIDHKYTRTGSKGAIFYHFILKYQASSPASTTIQVNHSDYQRWTENDVIAILYDPKNIDNVMIYENCRYKPIPIAAVTSGGP